MQEAFGIVVVVVAIVGGIAAILSIALSGRLYQQVGRGPLSVERRRAPVEDEATREEEIRQMTAALRSARGQAPPADPGLRDEVRDLVRARNARRVARGQPPLDVEAEVERRLRELQA